MRLAGTVLMTVGMGESAIVGAAVGVMAKAMGVATVAMGDGVRASTIVGAAVGAREGAGVAVVQTVRHAASAKKIRAVAQRLNMGWLSAMYTDAAAQRFRISWRLKSLP